MIPMKKLTNKKGFTLMEMIIVVAIIAILAVITVPTLTGNTKKAAKAADEANMRSAKAVYQVMTMENKALAGNYFNATSGEFEATEPTGYGQCDKHKGGYIKVTSEGALQWSKNPGECTKTDAE